MEKWMQLTRYVSNSAELYTALHHHKQLLLSRSECWFKLP